MTGSIKTAVVKVSALNLLLAVGKEEPPLSEAEVIPSFRRIKPSTHFGIACLVSLCTRGATSPVHLIFVILKLCKTYLNL